MPRTIFAVPPITTKMGQAQATQNRQYQYFKDQTYIFPVIPATFITMLTKIPGHQVLLVDSIAEELDEVDFGRVIIDMKPDFIVFEANTMVFKRYCEIIDGIKSNMPNIKIILCGEHTTACMEEAKQKAKADFFLHGGKWYLEAFKIVTGQEWPKDVLLPHIHRDAARWWLYAYNNGNFKRTPATYTMAAQDCWYRPGSGACTFCSWVDYHPENKIRPVEDFLEEVEGLINFGFKEFFDDSGTFPVGKWLHEFCNEMIDRGYNKHIVWGCNMRFGVLKPEEFQLMAKAGCRFILWGFETANQSTLDRLKKGYTIDKISPNLIAASLAGIWNHLTVMIGYPWETLEEEKRTFNMVKWLLVNGWASSMQATIFMPYPGTQSFRDAKKDGIILTEDWDDWTMGKQVVKLKYDFKEALKLQRQYYNISYNPRFIWNKISKIKDMDDLKFYWRLSKKVMGRFNNLFDSQGVAIDAK